MTVANGMIRRIAMVDESTYGVTPTAPAFYELRVRPGGGATVAKKTETIRQLTAHGNPIELVDLGFDVSGSYDVVVAPGGSFDTLLAASLKNAWATNTLWNGRAILSKTIEEKITGTADVFHRFPGCEIESLELRATARELLQASVTFQGQQGLMSTTSLASATYTAPTTTDPITGITVTSLSMVGLATAPAVRSISARIQHSLTPLETLGQKYRIGHVAGQIEVTGSVETLFEDKAAYDLFLNHSGGQISFTAGATANSKYTVTFPKVRFNEGNISAAGQGPVLATLGFTGLYDGTNGTVRIDKAVV